MVRIEKDIREDFNKTVLSPKDRGVNRAVLSVLEMWRQRKFRESFRDKFPLEVTKAIQGDRRHLLPREMEVIKLITSRNWTQEALSFSNPDHLELAAQAVALGAVICYGFGNFYAVAAHPCRESVVHVNRSKGRSDNQVGSVTTTRERMSKIFDWSQVPSSLNKRAILALMDELYEMGPFGFRGPAVPQVPDHLVAIDGDRRTTQIIAPGYRCPSNVLLSRILELTGDDFFFITSANISHNVTGSTEEPAHYKIKGIQNDFGKCRGFIMLSHDDEELVRSSYSKYRPMSTTILAFHKATYDREGRPQLFLERHGSLHIDDVEEIVRKYGFGLQRGQKAESRLPERHYL